MAERIAHLAEEITMSFRFDEASHRRAVVQAAASEILFGMLPVINWLERQRSADTANIVKGRLHFVLHEAVECAGLDIPEYAGGQIKRVNDQSSKGTTRTATLLVSTTVFAASLVEWANDIDAESNGKKMLPSNIPQQAAPLVLENPNDPRDKFIYENMAKGKTRIWVKNHLKKSWEQLESEQAVSAAARRYAERHKLLWPLRRKSSCLQYRRNVA
jgi:hypothetical protein